MKIRTVISETLSSHQNSIVTVMKYILLILILLSAACHLFVLVFFADSLSNQTQLYAFAPVYTTIIISYCLLEIDRTQMAIHTFLLGSTFTQLMLLVFVTGHTNYVYVSIPKEYQTNYNWRILESKN